MTSDFELTLLTIAIILLLPGSSVLSSAHINKINKLIPALVRVTRLFPMDDEQALQQTPENPPRLTVLFPQPTVDDIALGKHLFHPEDTRYIHVRRITWILAVRGLLLVATVFAAALLFFHPISLEDFHVSLSQVCFIVVFLIKRIILILTTFLSGKNRMLQETLPENQGRWYWGTLAIVVHISSTLSLADLIGFLVFQVNPSLQGTTNDVAQYVQVGWGTEIAIQRYVMAITAIVENATLLIPQHYVFVVIATAWYVLWQVAVLSVRNKSLSNGSIIVSLAGTSIVTTLSLMTVFFHQRLASGFKKQRTEEYYAIQKTEAKEIVIEDSVC